MSVLEFKGYNVKKMSYERNEHYDRATKNIELSPKITASNEITGDDEILVTLNVSVGSVSVNDKSIPFLSNCSVEGRFTYKAEQDDNDFGVDTFIRTNCVAILYPYVRALISYLTNSSNEYPAFNLPTINVAQALKKNTDDNN